LSYKTLLTIYLYDNTFWLYCHTKPSPCFHSTPCFPATSCCNDTRTGTPARITRTGEGVRSCVGVFRMTKEIVENSSCTLFGLDYSVCLMLNTTTTTNEGITKRCSDSIYGAIVNLSDDKIAYDIVMEILKYEFCGDDEELGDSFDREVWECQQRISGDQILSPDSHRPWLTLLA